MKNVSILKKSGHFDPYYDFFFSPNGENRSLSTEQILNTQPTRQMDLTDAILDTGKNIIQSSNRWQRGRLIQRVPSDGSVRDVTWINPIDITPSENNDRDVISKTKHDSEPSEHQIPLGKIPDSRTKLSVERHSTPRLPYGLISRSEVPENSIQTSSSLIANQNRLEKSADVNPKKLSNDNSDDEVEESQVDKINIPEVAENIDENIARAFAIGGVMPNGEIAEYFNKEIYVRILMIVE